MAYINILNVSVLDISIPRDFLIPSNQIHTEPVTQITLFAILAVLIFVVTGQRVSRMVMKVSSIGQKNVAKKNNLATLPGPRPFPWRGIGNMFQMPSSNDLISTVFKWCKQYKHCFLVTMFNEDFVVISNADMAKFILQSSEIGHLKKTEVYHLLQGIDGLSFASGSRWQSMRKNIGKLFHYQQLNNHIQVYNEHADTLLEKLMNEIDKNISLDLHIANYTVQASIGAFITNDKTACSYSESLNYILNWKRFTEIFSYRVTYPWLAISMFWKRHPKYFDQMQTISNVNSFAEALMKHHLDNPDNSVSSVDESGKTNLMSELLKLKYSFVEIRNEVVSLLMAHETHFLGFYYLLFMLATHPEHQKKCQQEVDKLFEEKNDHYITNDNLSQLKYLERCLLEALRLFPPVFMFGRKLEAELELSKDLVLPAGTNCLIVPIVIHRMEEYYDTPYNFNPDNFLPERVRKRPSYAYIPFSAGPRQCLGTKATIVSTKIAAAKILRKFDITSPIKFEDVKLIVTNLTTATEQDLDLHFLPRK